MHKRIIVLVVLLLALLGVWQRQFLHDRWRLYGYQPEPSIVQLADDTTMTAPARQVFYVNHPALQDRDAFGTACANQDEQTIVLGCYHPVDNGIYVFHVSDNRLSGVDQVTAAHELLHAEYDRLSSNERKHIDQLLQQFYNQHVTDKRLQAVIASYRKTEPNDVVNEMHSIFGTEVLDLTPELEAYYKQYFSNRSAVAAYAAQYQGEFTTRQAAVTQDDSKLDTLRKQVDSNTSTLKQQESAIASSRSQLLAARDRGDTAAYNAGVAPFNRQISAYNSLSQQTQQLIDTYNQLVATRNELALEVNQLANSINSAPTTIDQ